MRRVGSALKTHAFPRGPPALISLSGRAKAPGLPAHAVSYNRKWEISAGCGLHMNLPGDKWRDSRDMRVAFSGTHHPRDHTGGLQGRGAADGGEGVPL